MAIRLKGPITKEKLRKVLEKKQPLARHFGKLKRGLDGLAYQKKVRREWIA